jgi:spermidine synthase
LAYFSNFVLLGAFLGVGLGFLLSRRTARRPWFSPVTLAVVVVLVTVFPVRIDRSSSEIIYFTATDLEGPPAWLALPVVFVASTVIMTGSGQLVAEAFRELRPLAAYRTDILGSLAGIAGFALVSWLGWPPLVWGLVVAAGFVVLMAPPRIPLPVAAALMVIVAALAVESLAMGSSWSPYNKLQVVQLEDDRYAIAANGVPHQEALDPERRLLTEPMYDAPYRLAPGREPGRTLIIGAGSGSDVALSLNRGATRVDAVEIDPGILDLGREIHPDRPYDDPRVTTHTDDGRAFLQRRGDGEYDTIIFALPDSLTVVSGSGSLRLESYLFTEEALAEVQRVLADDGVFAMYNYYREPWLIDRLTHTVDRAFPGGTCVESYGGEVQAAAIVASSEPELLSCAPASVLAEAATDDRPFVYLREPSIPQIYLVTLAAILLFSLLSVRVVGGPVRPMLRYLDLFLLGAAFLLVETKSITGFALLFGTTWAVNAIVFFGILAAVLAAVEFTRRFPTPPHRVLYALLGVSLGVAYLIPNSFLLGLNTPLRVLIASAVTFLPVFIANVIFAKRLRSAADPILAFGANLLGAMFGGCLEYAALVLGHRNLIVVAGLIYLAAFVALRVIERPRSTALSPAAG